MWKTVRRSFWSQTNFWDSYKNSMQKIWPKTQWINLYNSLHKSSKVQAIDQNIFWYHIAAIAHLHGCVSGQLYNRTNSIHERAFGLVYQDDYSSLRQFLEKGNFVTINELKHSNIGYKNFQFKNWCFTRNNEQFLRV